MLVLVLVLIIDKYWTIIFEYIPDAKKSNINLFNVFSGQVSI